MKIKRIEKKKIDSGTVMVLVNSLTGRRRRMKFISYISFFLFAVTCTSYATDNNKYIFVGQNSQSGHEKTMFVLELMDEELENHFLINGNGEVYLKVDKIVAIPKENPGSISYFGSVQGTQPTSLQNSYEKLEVTCSKCRHHYTPRPGQRNCPRCGTPN